MSINSTAPNCHTDEQHAKQVFNRDRMLSRYDGVEPPEYSDTVMLDFIFIERPEFTVDGNGEVTARAFVRIQPKGSNAYTGWTPYGRGKSYRKSLRALIANYSDLELRHESLQANS